MRGPHYRQCLECESPFRPNKRSSKQVRDGYHQVYCSYRCSHKVRKRAYRLKTAWDKLNECMTRYKPCTHCGEQFFQTNGNKKYCSDECSYKNTHDPVVLSSNVCLHCGNTFMHNIKKKFCSLKCSRRAHKGPRNDRKRARLAGVEFEPICRLKLFDRDNWTCQLCGCPTPRSLKGTFEPNAPELDHIIPLSRGGPHLWTNVQCACRQCNGKKGNMISSDFD